MAATTRSIEGVLRDLPDRHRTALTWFAEHAGETTGWPVEDFDGTRLGCAPRSIYKPRWSGYALSIRQSMKGPNPDGVPAATGREPWILPYFQESLDPGERDAQYTNLALLENHRDGIPVGVLVQVQTKPRSEYEVLGLGRVGGWGRGFFPITELR